MISIIQRRLIVVAAGLAILISLLTATAIADDGAAAVLGIFNVTDSKGIAVAQYQLSMDTGGVTDPKRLLVAQALGFAWDSYRFWIGVLSYVIDWTVGMTWVTWITGPLNSVATILRNDLLKPVGLTSFGTKGAMSLLLTLAAAAAAIHIFRGRTGRGLIELVTSAAVAALSVGILAAPVVLFAGNDLQPAAPLRMAQRIGADLSNLVMGQELSNAPMEPIARPNSRELSAGTAEVASTIKPVQAGKMITNTFIRPVHQMVNYGQVIDLTNKKCVKAYDEALKAGPRSSDGAKETRDAIGDCDKNLKNYAEGYGWPRLIGLQLYNLTVALLSAVLLTFIGLLVKAVLDLAWAAFKLMFHVPMAIIPGDTRGPGIRDIIDIVVSLVYVVTGLAVLSILVRIIKELLSSTETVSLQVRFIGVDIILIVCVALLIFNYIAHRRGAKGLGQRLLAKLRQTNRPTAGQKAGSWLKQTPGLNYGVGPGGALVGAPGPMQKITSTNGARLAFGATRIAAGAATGGVGLALGATKFAGKSVKANGMAAGRAAGMAGKATQTAQRVHSGLRHGARHATTGHQPVDTVLTHTARAHNYLEAQTKKTIVNATTTGVMTAGGPRKAPDPADQHDHPAIPAQHTQAAPVSKRYSQQANGMNGDRTNPRPDTKPAPVPKQTVLTATTASRPDPKELTKANPVASAPGIPVQPSARLVRPMRRPSAPRGAGPAGASGDTTSPTRRREPTTRSTSETVRATRPATPAAPAPKGERPIRRATPFDPSSRGRK